MEQPPSNTDPRLAEYLFRMLNNATVNANAVNNSLVGINNSISSLTTRVTNLESSVASLTTTVNGHTTSINTLNSQVATNTSAISTLNGQVSTNTSNISSLTTRMNTAESNITSLGGRTTSLETRMTSAENSVSRLMNADYNRYEFFQFQFKTVTSSTDPGFYYCNVNNTNMSLATRLMVSDVDFGGMGTHYALDDVPIGTRILLTVEDTATISFIGYQTTSVFTNVGPNVWHYADVTCYTNTFTTLTNLTQVRMRMQFNSNIIVP